MFGNPSLVTRIAIGKSLGLVFGLIGLIFLPFFWPDADWFTRWGVLFWYITVGAFVGVFGVMTYHPVIKLNMPWYFRGPWIGGWMNFVLTFFAYDVFQKMLLDMFDATSIWASPWWFVLEGAIIGLLIDYVATRLGGEGKETINW